MYYLPRRAQLSGTLAWIAFIAGIACLLTTPFTQPNSIAVVIDSQCTKHGLDMGTLDLAGAEIAPRDFVVGVALGVLAAWMVCIGGSSRSVACWRSFLPSKSASILLRGWR